MNANLAEILTRSAERRPDTIAVKLDDFEANYALLDNASARIAGMLRSSGLQPGDRVGLMLPNVPYFPLVFYGVLRAGGIVVPMNVLLKEREVAFYLRDSGAEHLFGWHDFSGPAEEGASQAGSELHLVTPGEFEQWLFGHEPDERVEEREGDDTAVILYTSGTTGTPKGAELTHDNLRKNAEVSTRLAELREDDVLFGGLPLFHAFGLTCSMNTAVTVGATLTLLPRFDPGKALEIIERDHVTGFLGVPTMYNAMLHHEGHEQFDTSALRLCMSGGAAMPVEVLRGFEEAFGCDLLEGYGLSETSPVASFNQLHRPRKAGSIGTPIGQELVGEERQEPIRQGTGRDQ